MSALKSHTGSNRIPDLVYFLLEGSHFLAPSSTTIASNSKKKVGISLPKACNWGAAYTCHTKGSIEDKRHPLWENQIRDELRSFMCP